jgi:hypothetical protein
VRSAGSDDAVSIIDAKVESLWEKVGRECALRVVPIQGCQSGQIGTSQLLHRSGRCNGEGSPGGFADRHAILLSIEWAQPIRLRGVPLRCNRSPCDIHLLTVRKNCGASDSELRYTENTMPRMPSETCVRYMIRIGYLRSASASLPLLAYFLRQG